MSRMYDIGTICIPKQTSTADKLQVLALMHSAKKPQLSAQVSSRNRSFYPRVMCGEFERLGIVMPKDFGNEWGLRDDGIERNRVPHSPGTLRF